MVETKTKIPALKELTFSRGETSNIENKEVKMRYGLLEGGGWHLFLSATDKNKAGSAGSSSQRR